MSPDDTPLRTATTTHLIKSEDLNHHDTLYGGRCVEWAVEMAYITAQNCFDEPRSLVFISIRNLSVRAPGHLGDLVQYTGKVDYVGESTIGVKVDARIVQPRSASKTVVNGTFLFCTVDEEGKSTPHGLPTFTPESKIAEGRWIKAEQQAATIMP